MGYNPWEDNTPAPKKHDTDKLLTWDPSTRTWRDKQGRVVKSYDDSDNPLYLQDLEKRRRSHIRIANDGPIHLGSEDVYKHFRGITPSEMAHGNFSSPVSVVDIETGHNYEPISVSVLKGVYDNNTGEFRVIDTLERYYKPRNFFSGSFNISREIHKLTPAKIDALRKLQKAGYASTFDQNERLELLNILKGSIVVGHNVEEFDFSKLGITEALQDYRTLDTLIAAENIGLPRGKRKLGKIYSSIYKRTMKEAGYSAHFGFHDVMANAEVLGGMVRLRDKNGRDIRYVLNHAGVSYGAFEEAAGTAIIKGGYWQGRGPGGLSHYMFEDEFDEKGVFEYDHDDDGRRVLPEGWSEVDLGIPDDPDTGSTNYAQKKLDTYIGRTYEELQATIQRSVEVLAGHNATYNMQLERRISKMSESDARNYLQTVGVTDVKRQDRIIKGAQTYAKAKAQAMENIDVALGNLQSYVRDLNEETGPFNRKEAMATIDQYNNSVFGNLQSYVRDLNEEQGPFDRRNFDYANRLFRNKQITGKQFNSLDLSQSYDDLVEATDALIKKNEELRKIYTDISNIKPYDINQYINAARGQFQGIMGASRGVIPSFISNPLSRLGGAVFNAVDRSVAPWNAVNRVWNSGIGRVIEGVSPIGGRVVSGVINAGTQVFGNYKQAQLEMKGLEIQNTLNTLGAISEWITTPFRLLYKATKLLTGSFTGLTHVLKNLMTNGLNDMNQMGNPLTELTGINYATYQGASMLDVASLLNRGSMNSIYENFASQQRALYTTGQMDQNRMIGAAMLGVFGQAYTPTTDAAGTYNNMANSILQRMATQSDDEKARTMYLASLIDSNLPSVLRTANMLGVTDVNQFMNPRNRGMYWNPITDNEEGAMRWAQYEYGTFKEQWGTTKKRLAKGLWNAGGKDIYNGFVAMTDAIATGNWKEAMNQFTAVWTKFRETLLGVWDGIKENLSGTKEGAGIVGIIKSGLATVGYYALEVCKKIISAWDEITLKIMDKTQGLVAYLSTVSLKPVRNEDGSYSIQMHTIRDSYNTLDMQNLKANSNDMLRSAFSQMPSGLASAIGLRVHGNVASGEDLYKSLSWIANNPEIWNQDVMDSSGHIVRQMTKGIDIPGIVSGWMPESDAEIREVLKAVNADASKGSGMRASAALQLLRSSGVEIHGVLAKPDNGYMDDAKKLLASVEGESYPIINGMQNQLKEQVITLDFKTDGKRIAAVSYEGGKKIAERGITNLENYMSKFLEIYAADRTQ